MRKLMNSRKFRENYTLLNESVTVIRRDEILGTWTPNKEAIRRRNDPAEVTAQLEQGMRLVEEA